MQIQPTSESNWKADLRRRWKLKLPYKKTQTTADLLNNLRVERKRDREGVSVSNLNFSLLPPSKGGGHRSKKNIFICFDLLV